MEERKNLFETIREVIGEIEHLQNENKCLKEEINNRESARIECDAYVKKLIKERHKLREEIDNKEETIQSLVDEYNARCEYNKRLLAENNRLHNEMKLMVKDHEEECDDYIAKLKEKVDINDLHFIFSEYLDGKYEPSSTAILLFQIMYKIKEYIDKQKN